jgi:CheY-like chemotaxis protein
VGNGEPDLAVPRDLPVLSVHLPGKLQNAASLGVYDFLIKPITRERLFEAMEGLGRPVRNVLVVDEDPAQADLASRMLQAGGCGRIYKAWGGSEALTVLRRESVDLVLLDWLKTDVTGLMVLEEKQQIPSLADIPVIVTGSEWPDEMISKEGLDLRLIRTEKASVAEMVKYLELLVGGLPPRRLTDAEAVPPVPAAPAVPPVS